MLILTDVINDSEPKVEARVETLETTAVYALYRNKSDIGGSHEYVISVRRESEAPTEATIYETYSAFSEAMHELSQVIYNNDIEVDA